MTKHTLEGVTAFGRSPRPTARNGESTRAQDLVREATSAARLRAYQTDPDVVALRIEHIRTQVDRMCWAGILLGLAFTMTNVQSFAAAGAAAWTTPWLAAWLLDPMVSVVLLAILRAEQVTARYQVKTGPWVRVAKWFTLGATYVMNTWSSYAAGNLSGIVLHSVPPLMVFAAAEAVTDLRDKLTDAVAASVTLASTRLGPSDNSPTSNVERRQRRANAARTKQPRRKLFDDYLSEAREAWRPGIAVTPTWIRQTTGCSRGLSSRLAATLAAELDATERVGRS